MRIELKVTMLLLCLALSAQSAFGAITFTGGSGSNAEYGDAGAWGGAYYDIDDTPIDGLYYARYGIEANANTWGQGIADSAWKNKISVTKTPYVIAWPTNPNLNWYDSYYNIDLQYNANTPYTGVMAHSKQTSDLGNIHSFATIWTEAEIDNQGQWRWLDGEAEIYAESEINYAEGETEASADGLVGYNVNKIGEVLSAGDEEVEEVWGAVKGTAKTTATSDDDEAYLWNEAGLDQYSIAGQDNDWDDFESWSDSWMWAESVAYADGGDDVEAHGTSYADGYAMGGAWDRSTPIGTVKQNGVNENAYTKVEGTIDPVVDVYEEGDVAEAQAYMEAYAESEEDWDTYHIKLQAWNQAVSFARVEREKFDENDDRVTAEAFIIDADFISRAYGDDQNAIATESASGMNIASGAHAVNPSDDDTWDFENQPWEEWGWSDWNGDGWKSRARFVQSAEWDDEAWSSADTELDYDIETYGPQFMVSGTNEDDAGSYNKIGESEMLAARGSALAQVTTEDYSLSAMDWVEGSDMGINIHKLGDFDAFFNGANFNNELDDLEVETEYDTQHSDEWRYQQLEVNVDFDGN